MAAPVRGTNGRSVAGEPIAADPAADEAADAAERATSSVLALDGWGRLEPEPHANGAAPPEAETEAAPDPDESAEVEAGVEVEAGPEATAEVEAEVEAEPEATAAAPDAGGELSELPWDRRATEALAALRERAGSHAPQLRPIGFDAAPGLRLLGPALIFGLAVGAIVGAALRWLELLNAPPPAPPAPDPAMRLRRRLAALQEERAAEIAELRRRLQALGVGEPPAPEPEPTLSERIRGLW